MPIIVTGTGGGTPVEPTLPLEAVSGDRILTVTVDLKYSGIRLTADFKNRAGPLPDKVIFRRVDILYPFEVDVCDPVLDSPEDLAMLGSQEVVSVRGADPATAVFGIARGYDREASLGAVSLYYAAPVDRNGVEGEPSQMASVVLPKRTDDKDLWIRSMDEPQFSMAVVHLDPVPEVSVASAFTAVYSQNSRYPGGSIERRRPAPLEVNFMLDTIAQRWRLEKLIDTGHLLIQFEAETGIPPFYAVAETSTQKVVTVLKDPRRIVTVGLQPMHRPPTLDTAQYVPGFSIAEVHRIAPTIAQAKALWPTVAEAAGYPVGGPVTPPPQSTADTVAAIVNDFI